MNPGKGSEEPALWLPMPAVRGKKGEGWSGSREAVAASAIRKESGSLH